MINMVNFMMIRAAEVPVLQAEEATGWAAKSPRLPSITEMYRLTG